MSNFNFLHSREAKETTAKHTAAEAKEDEETTAPTAIDEAQEDRRVVDRATEPPSSSFTSIPSLLIL